MQIFKRVIKIEKEKKDQDDTLDIIDIINIIKNDVLNANERDDENFKLFITKAELMLTFVQKQFNLQGKLFDDPDSEVEESGDNDIESNEPEREE